jgi:hypothetical protein
LSINRLILFRFPIYRLEKKPTVKRYIERERYSFTRVNSMCNISIMPFIALLV